jgi:hypothetical protein
MEWTPEAVQNEMNYRLETARRHATVRQLREARVRQPSWWSRLRTQHVRAA